MQEKRLIIRGIYVNYLHLFVGFLAVFILTPIMIRYLGQTAYGLWAVFYSSIGYFALFDFGMNTAVAKYTAEYRAKDQKENLTKLVSTTFTAFIFISCFIVLICIVITPFVPGLFKIPESLISEGKTTFLIMGFNVALMLLGGVFGNIIYGYQRVDIWKTFSIIQLIANALFTILLLRLGFGLTGVAVAYILSTLTLISLYLLFLHRSKYGIVVNPRLADAKIFKETAPYSIRTFLLGITNRLLNYTDYIVIGIFLGAISVTPYEIVYKLCFLATYSFSVISSTIFPRFSKLYALGDIEGLRGLYLKTVKVSVGIMMPVTIFLLFFGCEFINLWVGPGNFAGMKILLVLLLMNFIHVVGTPAASLLQGIGKNREFVYSEVINAVLNLALSIVLIRSMGLIGVALGTLVASLCTSAWFIPMLACKYTELPVKTYIKHSILPPLLVGVVVGGIVWIFKDNLFTANNFFYLGLNGILIVVVYIVIYLCLGSTREERKMYYRLLQIKA